MPPISLSEIQLDALNLAVCYYYSQQLDSLQTIFTALGLPSELSA